MNGWAWVHLLSAASGLAVGLLAVTRGSGSRLGLPLALLGVDQFAIGMGSFGDYLAESGRYAMMGAVASTFFGPFALHFVLVFAGSRRAASRLLHGAYAFFGLQAVAAAGQALGVWSVPGGLGTLSLVLLVTSLPLAAVGLVIVARHGLSTRSSLERARSGVLLLAIVTVATLVSTDLLADLDPSVPRLSSLGLFAFNALLTLLVLGLGLFPTAAGRWAALGQAGLFTLFGLVGYLAVSQLFGTVIGALMTASAAVTLGLAAAAFLVRRGTQRERDGNSRFTTLGRFSAQMAHDLKTPLAAARGGAEYLVEEMRRHGQPGDVDFAVLVVEQLDRLGAVIDRYQRLSTVTAELQPLDLNALVRRTLALERFADPAAEVRLRLAPAELPVRADPDLLASALENLVKNALEAMPRGGVLTVSTRLDQEQARRKAVVAVADTGTGLDARAQEQAFDLFFTTKASGSGLGLPFVLQVARAHGGDARLTSHEGSGTVVEVFLPA